MGLILLRDCSRNSDSNSKIVSVKRILALVDDDTAFTLNYFFGDTFPLSRHLDHCVSAFVGNSRPSIHSLLLLGKAPQGSGS